MEWQGSPELPLTESLHHKPEPTQQTNSERPRTRGTDRLSIATWRQRRWWRRRRRRRQVPIGRSTRCKRLCMSHTPRIKTSKLRFTFKSLVQIQVIILISRPFTISIKLPNAGSYKRVASPCTKAIQEYGKNPLEFLLSGTGDSQYPPALAFAAGVGLKGPCPGGPKRA